MRITTRLRIISTVTAAALVVLAPVLIWSFLEFKSANNDDSLADAISAGFSERTSFSGQYFLYREGRIQAQWDKSNKAIDRLLRQAEVQFHSEKERQVLERLRRNMEGGADILNRIIKNNEVLKTAVGNRQVYEELDKRLFSQLLLKNVATRDMTTALKDASTRHIEKTYRYLTIVIGLFAFTLALATILTSMQIGRLIRKRLTPLHDGAKIVAGGDLDHRIKCDGADEFAELALSINAMTDKLEAEISAHKQAEEKIKELNQNLEMRVIERTAQLEASGKDMEDFNYNISHDLRAPLRAIDSFSRILLEEYAVRLDDEGRRMLKVVGDNARKMGQLIDDLLAFSRTGRIKVERSAINMKNLVAGVWEELQPGMVGRDVRLDIRDMPPAEGDPATIRQVVFNLLSNAVKFTQQRADARIEVGGHADEHEAVYHVKDNGVGFDMQYAPKLFGVFQRLHGMDEFEGTGIGLAIVKRIIAKHDGRVWAEGKVNEGATIYFALPYGKK